MNKTKDFSESLKSRGNRSFHPIDVSSSGLKVSSKKDELTFLSVTELNERKRQHCGYNETKLHKTCLFLVL